MFKFSLCVIKRRHCSVALRRRITHTHDIVWPHHISSIWSISQRSFDVISTVTAKPPPFDRCSSTYSQFQWHGKVARCLLNMLSHPNSKVHFNYDIWNLRRVGVRPVFPNSKYATGTDRLNGGICNGSCASAWRLLPWTCAPDICPIKIPPWISASQLELGLRVRLRRGLGIRWERCLQLYFRGRAGVRGQMSYILQAL